MQTAVEKYVPNIAENEKAFIESLFTGPKTFDGFIRKKGKRFVDFWFMGEEYRINCWGVPTLKSDIDGQTIYSIGGRFNSIAGHMARHEWVDSLAVSKDHSKSETFYTFA